MPLVFLEFVTDGRFLDFVPLGGFRKGVISKGMPLDFLEFVTDRGILEIVTLSDFYKSWISRRCAIRLFHRQGNIQSCDIKYLASRRE